MTTSIPIPAVALAENIRGRLASLDAPCDHFDGSPCICR